MILKYKILWYEGYIMSTPSSPPSAVRRILLKIGRDIHQARKLRGLSMEVVAQRAHTSRKTLQRIEAGEYQVNIGIYLSVLLALDLLENVEDIADITNDPVGRQLLSLHLAKKSKL